MSAKLNMRSRRDVAKAVIDLLATPSPAGAHSTEAIRGQLDADLRHHFLDKVLDSLEDKGNIVKNYSLNPKIRRKDLFSLQTVHVRGLRHDALLASLEAKGMIGRSYLLKSSAKAMEDSLTAATFTDAAVPSATAGGCPDGVITQALCAQLWLALTERSARPAPLPEM